MPQRRERGVGSRRRAGTRRAHRRCHRRQALHQQSMLDAMEPKGVQRYWKTEFLPGLPGEFLDAFREGALGVRSPLSQSVIFHLGGALNDHDDDDGAIGNRDARYIAGFAGTWPPATPPEPHVTWVRGSWGAHPTILHRRELRQLPTRRRRSRSDRRRLPEQLSASPAHQGPVRPRKPIPGEPQHPTRGLNNRHHRSHRGTPGRRS